MNKKILNPVLCISVLIFHDNVCKVDDLLLLQNITSTSDTYRLPVQHAAIWLSSYALECIHEFLHYHKLLKSYFPEHSLNSPIIVVFYQLSQQLLKICWWLPISQHDKNSNMQSDWMRWNLKLFIGPNTYHLQHNMCLVAFRIFPK